MPTPTVLLDLGRRWWMGQLHGWRHLTLPHAPTAIACACATTGSSCNRTRRHGFCLVNFAAAAVVAHLRTHPNARVAVLDWDVHHGNGIAEILSEHARARYCSTHEAGSFPRTGLNQTDRGPLANILNLRCRRAHQARLICARCGATHCPSYWAGGRRC